MRAIGYSAQPIASCRAARSTPHRAASVLCRWRTSFFRPVKNQRRAPAPLCAQNAGPETEDDTEYCTPAFVTVDNESDPNSTVLHVEIKDYPGLLRIIAWVLNGMDLRAENARVQTNSEGIAENTFYITTVHGKKLGDKTALMLEDRLQDYLMYCKHQEQSAEAATEFMSGPISVSNTQDPHASVITVREDKPRPGFLLVVASALTGLNTQIQQGTIQGTGHCKDKEAGLQCDSRVFKFWVQNRSGGKLDYAQASSLLFTLNVILGNYQHPLSPPDANFLAEGSAKLGG